MLITLDMDFSNPFRFPPFQSEGIIVVRPPRPILPAIRAILDDERLAGTEETVAQRQTVDRRAGPRSHLRPARKENQTRPEGSLREDDRLFSRLAGGAIENRRRPHVHLSASRTRDRPRTCGPTATACAASCGLWPSARRRAGGPTMTRTAAKWVDALHSARVP